MPKPPRSSSTSDRTDPQITVPEERTDIGPAPQPPPGRRQGRSAGAPVLRQRLVVVAGRDEGRALDLGEGTIVIGRGADCDVILPDSQVSRQHVEIETTQAGVILTDLGSGNGTLVNGRPIESVELAHRDEIVLGDHILRFEEQSEAASTSQALAPHRRQSPANIPGGGAPLAAADIVRQARRRRTQKDQDAKKPFLILGGALVVVLGAIVAFLALQPGEPEEPLGPSSEEVAQQSFSVGMRLFREASYEEALPHFEEAVANMPEHSQANRYLAATRREIEASASMERGNELLSEEDYEGARQAFSQVGHDSLLHEEAKQALDRTDQAEANDLVSEATHLLEVDALDDAKAVFERALVVIPNFEPARRGLERVEQRRRQLSRMTSAQRAAAAAAAARKEREEEERATQEVRRALRTGEQLFDQESFGQAQSRFEELAQHENPDIARPARQKAEALVAFRPAYERGIRLAGDGEHERAITELTQAERRARIISPNGRVHQSVRNRLADMHNMRGRIAMNSERYTLAFKHWSAALQANRNHSASRDGMDDLARIAEQLYLEAYASRTLNRAESIRKFRQVMSMTTPSSQTHQRARDRIAELE